MTCRICAKPRAAVDLKPLQTEILAKVRKILPIVIVDGDPLPHDICYPCESKVTALSDFYDDSLRADMFLRTSLPSATQKTIPDSNAILNFYASGQFLTAAYKTYLDPCVSVDLSKDFHTTKADKTVVYSCRRCSSNFVTSSGAMRHFCNKDRKGKKKKEKKESGNGIVEDIICLSGDEDGTSVEVAVNTSSCSNGTQRKRKIQPEENNGEKSKGSTKSDKSETNDDSSSSTASSSIVKPRKQARVSFKEVETVPG